MPVLLTWDKVNTKHNQDTKPLQLFKKWIARPYWHVIDWLWELWDFFRAKPWYKLFIAIWLLYIGFYTFVVEGVAYYLHLLNFKDFSALYRQFLKTISDMLLNYKILPFFCWTILAIYLFSRWRVKHGKDKLQHLDAQDKGMLKQLPMCSFVVAPPRTGKGVMITDMSVKLAGIHRETAREQMAKYMKMFPRFPWILFEAEIQKRRQDGSCKNLAHLRHWIGGQHLHWTGNQCKENIWNYDTDTYTTHFNDDLTVQNIWYVLECYAQAYWIYSHPTSLITSNYPIRDDFLIFDNGNLPEVDTCSLARDPALIPFESKMSHIINWNAFRLGMKMGNNDPFVGSFEYGVVAITEIDKERKNMDQLKEVRAREEECNQKNDGFNPWMKMAGHAAVIDNKVYLHILTDAQRPSSWGADGHELCVILHIDKHEEDCNALPLFWIEEATIGRFLKWWDKVWNKRRSVWGDNHLTTWLMHGFISWLFTYYYRHSQHYGYYTQEITSESGTQEEKVLKKLKYYVLFKTAYPGRFATDYFRGFSELNALKCRHGLNDMPIYRTLYPSKAELQKMQSHMNKDLFKWFNMTAPEITERYDQTDENLDPEEFKYYTEVQPARQQLAQALRAYLKKRKNRH